MARLASQAKAGFYPTPKKIVDDLVKILNLSDGVRVLDPCCGEGNALADVKTAYPTIRTYGVELDSNRYGIAKNNIDHCLNCDAISEVKITNGVFDVLWENPPYDYDTKGDEITSTRLEKKFLNNHARYLKSDGGILVYIIPITVLDHIRALITKYHDLQILAFPKEYYSVFKQIVILGRSSKSSDKTNFLKNSALIDKVVNDVDFERAYEQLPATDTTDLKYDVSSNSNELKTFYTSRINPSEAVELLKLSPLNHSFLSIQTYGYELLNKKEIAGDRNDFVCDFKKDEQLIHFNTIGDYPKDIISRYNDIKNKNYSHFITACNEKCLEKIIGVIKETIKEDDIIIVEKSIVETKGNDFETNYKDAIKIISSI